MKLETKTCTRCHIEQDIENFYVRRTRNNQRKSVCKGCESIQKATKVKVVPDLEGEIWKDVPGYEGIYVISNMGRLKRIMHRKHPTNTIINASINDYGYHYSCLTINGKGQNHMIHRLVGQAFIPNPEDKPQVNHIDGCKSNNVLQNLEWNTSKENINHAWDTGLAKPKNGILNGNAVLTEKDILEIRASSLTPLELSLIYKIKREQVYKILRRERWTHI